MTRNWIGRTAVRLYPADVRAAHGDELVGTMLDAGDYSLFAFVRQLVSLIVAGLLARSRDVLSQPLGQLASDTVRWAAVITIGRELAARAVVPLGGGSISSQPATIWIAYLGPALVLALFISRRDRATGIVGLAWCLIAATTDPRIPMSHWIDTLALPIIGSALMTIAPRRSPDPGRALVLVPLLAWAFYIWTELGWHYDARYPLLLLPVLVAAVFVTVKPALVLATALTWTLLAVGIITISEPHATVLSIELLSCVPLALALTGLSRRALTRS